jgi:hypothetical protein
MEKDVNSPLEIGGAAIYLSKFSKLQCINCKFEKNFVSGNKTHTKGGSINVNLFSSIDRCDNCVFNNNFAHSGGAIIIKDNSII